MLSLCSVAWAFYPTWASCPYLPYYRPMHYIVHFIKQMRYLSIMSKDNPHCRDNPPSIMTRGIAGSEVTLCGEWSKESFTVISIRSATITFATEAITRRDNNILTKINGEICECTYTVNTSNHSAIHPQGEDIIVHLFQGVLEGGQLQVSSSSNLFELTKYYYAVLGIQLLSSQVASLPLKSVIQGGWLQTFVQQWTP